MMLIGAEIENKKNVERFENLVLSTVPKLITSPRLKSF
jgi:hypothetical protein